MTDRFSQNIVISLGLHFAVVLVIFFRAVLIPSENLDLRDAIRVDMVDLPKKMQTLPETTPPAPTPAPAPAPEPVKPEPVKVEPPKAKPKLPEKPKPDTVNLKKSQANALHKLKEMSAFEKLKESAKNEASKKPKAADVVRGNKVSAGNSLTGLERLDYNRYYDELKAKVNSNLSIPQWLADADLRAQVQVLIDERGYVTKRTIVRSSNNDVFDAKVIEAIDASSPLPPPPERLRGLLSSSGITFNFPQ
jgi:TonB family protein